MSLEIIKNRYVIEKQIGKGGMSEVFLCKDLLLKTYWAGKRIWKNCNDSNLAYEALKKETEMLVRLKHKSIPAIIDCLDTDESYIVIMELINGISLHQKVIQESISEMQIVQWAKSILNILHYLHHEVEKPIIFRDLKPENLLINENNEIMLIDFGIALYLESEKVDNTPCLGTRGYASKEQSTPGYIDCRSDYYSFGATLFFLYTKTIYRNQEIPKGVLYDVIEKCLQEDADSRYKDVDQILDAINPHNFYKFKFLKLIIIGILFLCISLLANNKYLQQKDDLYFSYIKNEEYERAIALDASKKDAYFYYYSNCKTKSLPYAIQIMDNLTFNELSINDKDEILYEIAFDCFLMQELKYYQLAATYLRQIKYKNVDVYIKLCDLLGNNEELSYGKLEEFLKVLIDLEDVADMYEYPKQRLQLYEILVQSYTSQIKVLGIKAYENILRITEKGISLTNNEPDESSLIKYRRFFCEIEVLTYGDMTIFLKIQGQYDIAQQHYQTMLHLFNEYKEDLIDSNYVKDKVLQIENFE